MMQVRIYNQPYNEFINKMDAVPGVLTDSQVFDGILGIGSWFLFTVKDKKYVAITIEPFILFTHPLEIVADVPDFLLDDNAKEYVKSIAYAYLITLVDNIHHDMPDKIKVGRFFKKEIDNQAKIALGKIVEYLQMLHTQLLYRPTSIVNGYNIIDVYFDVFEEEVPYIY